MNNMELEGSKKTSRPPSVVERYFKKRYKTDIQGKANEDQLVLSHSNRICVVCIAESHPILSEKKGVSSVHYEGNGWNRLDNTVSGKNKRGAQWLERSAPLCHIVCSDGSSYTMRCCIKGQLVEVNTNLMTNPALLTQKPSCEGYLAIILPGLKGFDREMDHLKSEETYRDTMETRKRIMETSSDLREGTDSNILLKGSQSSTQCSLEAQKQTVESEHQS